MLEQRKRDLAQDLADAMQGASLADRLRLAETWIPGRIVFTTGFGLEGSAILHALFTSETRIEAVTLDTGRLFPETYELWAEIEARYGRSIAAYVPDARALERLVVEQGAMGFRRSVEARQACCAVRKVEPLGRVLQGAEGWVTGLRAGQSRDRARTPLVERDAARGLYKVNPLADWSRDEVARYVADNAVPYNPLHDRGFASIGCAPCTRAVRIGEPERAGRWWWESEAKKECGLHLRLVPAAGESEPAA